MTVTDEELKAWKVSKIPLLERREYQQPEAWALGRETFIPAAGGCVEVKFYQSGVNIGGENELTLAIVEDVLRSDGSKTWVGGGTKTIALTVEDLRAIIGVYPRSLVESASPTNHGNVWALKMMLLAEDRYKKEAGGLKNRQRLPVLHVSYDLMQKPESVEEVYLRLMLQSLRKTMPLETSAVRPNEAFGMLTNLAWTDFGVYTLDEFDQLEGETEATTNLDLKSTHQDKIPRLIDYVRPRGVRIADGNRVRLGAYLAEGTTVMHEGFANFNAVTLGASMIEGRISAGVIVGAGSDLGGGVSTIGTMSGGNNIRVSIGEGCLLGAESTLGIPLGDRVHLAAGTTLIGSMPIRVGNPTDQWIKQQTSETARRTLLAATYYDGPLREGPTFRAEELAGINDALIRVDSQLGKLEVFPRGDREWPNLTSFLHAN